MKAHPRKRGPGRTKKPRSVPAYDGEFLKPTEAAVYIRMSPDTLSDWRIQGVGPAFIRVGRYILYKRADLNAWMESRRVDPGAR